MRDPLLNESLRRLSAEAATRLTTLVASGDQIPFDVAESAGPDDSLFHSYVPLTGRFIRDREPELRSLPAFEPAREAIELAGVAAAYLESRGEAVPADGRERAARMITVFTASLWDGCSEFSLDRERLEAALAVLDAEAGDVDESEFVVVPVSGLQMSMARLQLPHGMQLVRADAFDAPSEAQRSEGMGREAWEPQFLAIAEQGEGVESAAAALRQLHELISVMRLFKPGGIGLGPYAFAPTGQGSWRRIATGAPTPRRQRYRLDEAEAAQLAELAERLEAQPDPSGALSWAVRRFDLGCERPRAVEGMSDHLLALRAVLEGHGPVGASLPMRAAALVADGTSERLRVREQFESAQELERAAMAGADREGAAALAGWVEESVRAILRKAALGEIGSDLNEAADETLIASGLDAGDAAIAVVAQEEATVPEPLAPEPVEAPVAEFTVSGPATPRAEDFGDAEDFTEPVQQMEFDPPSIEEDYEMNQETRILEPIPAEDEIRITATDWLHEVEVEEDGGTIEFPAAAIDVEYRERIDTPRVRHLFPVPEDADWEVRELKYDRRAG